MSLKLCVISKSKKILILGGSGFIGYGFYKELQPYHNVHATYRTPDSRFYKNQKFHYWDAEIEPLELLLENLKPNLIISTMRGDFKAQSSAHMEAIAYVLLNDCQLVFLSSANVFDAFTNFPSYEYDKTFSTSIYGRFKIEIENALLRLPAKKFLILRLPMVFGKNSPRIEELKTLHKIDEPIEVFPNVVINATVLSKVTQQVHYLINHNLNGIYHLGSTDLVHHNELILDLCKELSLEHPKTTQVYESNDDRFLALLPKENILPKHLQINIKEVINHSVIE